MKIRAILFSIIFIIVIVIFPCSYYIMNQIAYANGTNIDIDIGEKRDIELQFKMPDGIQKNLTVSKKATIKEVISLLIYHSKF